MWLKFHAPKIVDTYMNAIVINAKRVFEFEREQRGICRMVWREKRKG